MPGLFDELARTETGPAGHAEPEFTYLNRSARPEVKRIREVLEAWFSHYPEVGRADLRGRFRSPSNNQHRSAFFELLLHELLSRLNCRVTIHPTPPTGITRCPDFLVEPDSGEPFYLEAVVATDESAMEAAGQARMNAVYDVLDQMESPNVFIGIRFRGAPATSPPASRIRSFLSQHLVGLDPDEIGERMRGGGLEALPHWLFEHEGWRLDFFPIPKSQEARGKPGVRPIGVRIPAARYVNSRAAIRDAIMAKGNRYGELDRAYVVAVNGLAWHLDTADAMEALFGTEQVVVTYGPDGPVNTEMTRARDGAWLDPSGPRYTRISAVLVTIGLSPWSVTTVPARLYHHPWATRSCPAVLSVLPKTVPVGDRMELRDGKGLAELLGLPAAWPRVEAAEEGASGKAGE